MGRERRSRERQLTAEEIALWRSVVAEAKPLDRREPAHRRRLHHPAKPAPAAERPAPPAPRPKTRPKKPPAEARPIDRATRDRLRKGRMTTDGRVDLHGLTAVQAEQRLSAFLRSAQSMGWRAVLVITGRGLDPEGSGRGVIRREAPHWMNRMADVVASYGPADRRHGGDGALYVRIRRKDRVK